MEEYRLEKRMDIANNDPSFTPSDLAYTGRRVLPLLNAGPGALRPVSEGPGDGPAWKDTAWESVWRS